MSEFSLVDDPTENDVTRGENDLLMALRNLRRFKRTNDTFFQRHDKVLDLALDASVLAKTSEDQEEIEETVRKFDPIMWDLIRERITVDTSSSTELFRQAIVVFDKNEAELRKKHSQIIRPHLWGMKLAPPYRRYTPFVTQNIYRSYGLLVTVSLVFVASSLSCYYWNVAPVYEASDTRFVLTLTSGILSFVSFFLIFFGGIFASSYLLDQQ